MTANKQRPLFAGAAGQAAVYVIRYVHVVPSTLATSITCCNPCALTRSARGAFFFYIRHIYIYIQSCPKVSISNTAAPNAGRTAGGWLYAPCMLTSPLSSDLDCCGLFTVCLGSPSVCIFYDIIIYPGRLHQYIVPPVLRIISDMATDIVYVQTSYSV